MLKLVDIKKDYKTASSTVHALKGVSLEFRKNEFVSVLGASGCGKTTLLNIIGGLDHYTSGDLVILGKSTKDFKDADWDVYRNHRIGFIFQSYNLIPHQTVLQNVELALNIAGIPAEERKARATEALKKVGLEEQINKRPNQLSGGQMQRVAIARALVNNPEILLADEPTGALDSETSVQIMELIKEISGERLVIMVTHNPELAEKYSSRIVRLHDGLVIADSNPYHSEESVSEVKTSEEKNRKEKRKEKKSREKASMSFASALKLSFKNLLSKRARTIVTSIAGSIGIIGVSLVLALSAGIQNYITGMQDDMLSGNPITISETGYNVNALMDAMDNTQKVEVIKENGRVYIDSYVESLAKMGSLKAEMLVKNNITAEYADYVKSMPENYYAAMTVDYGVDILHSLYTDYNFTMTSEGDQTVNASVAMAQSLLTNLLEQTDYKDFTEYISMFTDIFAQAPESSDGNGDYIASQYEVKAGKIATEKNEVMLVMNKRSESTDLLLAQLGFISQNSFVNRAYKASGGEYDESEIQESISYEEILEKTFTWYPNNAIYKKNPGPSLSSEYGGCSYIYQPFSDELGEGLEIKIVGILQPKEDISYGCLRSGVYYTKALTEYIIEQNADSEIFEYINNDNNKGTVYSGIYNYTLGEHTIEVPVGIGYKYSYVYNLGKDDEKNVDVFDFVGVNSNSGYGMLMSMFLQMSGNGGSVSNLKPFTLSNAGGNDIPGNIAIYPIDFDKKNLATDYLDRWNDENAAITYTSLTTGEEITLEADAREHVTYTDSIETIINMINTMISIVTGALIAFTSISLVVSSVMIGVITYVSVVERTKEIGVLRAIGARKKDIKHLFNAETFIIGFMSGLIGVLITYLISIPVNLILASFTGIYGIAALPVYQAAIMIAISVVLTLISGLVPASAAAKKDPVIALRTE